MEKKINWGLKLSLEQMTLRRVSANIWMEFDILALIEKFQFKSTPDPPLSIWQAFVHVENKVKIKISKLVLPESLKKQMIYLVRPMASDILRWKICHERILDLKCLDVRILKQLCWTSVGVIDYRNTAERLVRLEMVNTFRRYHLACLYCLVNYIGDLWKKLPKHIKCHYNNSDDHDYPRMTEYWSFILTKADCRQDHINRSELPISFYRHAFTLMARGGNKVATEWFFQKLPQVERYSSLFTTASVILTTKKFLSGDFSCSSEFPTEQLSNVISYLLSLMNPYQQMKILKDHPCEILGCFLNWPWQDLFLEIADVVWTFLPEIKYHYLLFLIIDNVKDMGNYSPSFFCNFFLRCCSNFRKFFLNFYNSLFFEILKAEDTDTIKAIFRNVDIEDRIRFIFSSKCFQYLDQLIMTDKWHLIEVCIREATMSKEEMERLKKAFISNEGEYDERITARERRFRKRKWGIFFQCLDAANGNSLKRGCEGDMMNKTKKKNFIE